MMQQLILGDQYLVGLHVSKIAVFCASSFRAVRFHFDDLRRNKCFKLAKTPSFCVSLQKKQPLQKNWEKRIAF